MRPPPKTKLIVYTPWTQAVLDSCLAAFADAQLPVLDLELSATCHHDSCIYCDSPVGAACEGEMALSDIRRIATEGKELGLKWVHICGLGEPSNDPKFREIVSLFSNKNTRLSVFTNGIGHTMDDAKFLRDNKVCIILKMDSFKENVFDYLLGREGAARSVYRTIDCLLQVGYGQESDGAETDLAFSIVPTVKNFQEIPAIVRYCREHNIFPSIGELEYSGKAKSVYDALAIPNTQLLELKRNINRILGHSYQRPVCPAAIAGIHINNLGRCVVHKPTGLNCSWFLLREPEYVELGDIRTDALSDLIEKLNSYRKANIRNTIRLLRGFPDAVFGGCGGQARNVLDAYLKLRMMKGPINGHCV